MVRFQIECILPFPRELFWKIRDSPTFFDFIVQDGLLKELSSTAPEFDADGWGSRTQQYCPAQVDCPNMVRAVVGDTLFAVSDEQRWNDRERPCHLQFFIKPSFLSGMSRTAGELSIEHFPSLDSIENDTELCLGQDVIQELGSESDNNERSSDSGTDLEASDESEASDMEDFESVQDYINRLNPREKCKHVVSGETRVNIMTVGWFVERAIVHNLRGFYEKYPATIARFRQKLYRDFGKENESMPIDDIVERYLQEEERRAASQPDEKDEQNIASRKVEIRDNLYDSESDEEEDQDKEDDDLLSPTRIDEDLESLMLPS